MRMNGSVREVVASQGLGFVATTNDDGTPNLSPKGTTAVWDDEHLVFAHIHSPGTVRNIDAGRTTVEVNVVDPIRRKGYRFRGTALAHHLGDVYERGAEFYETERGVSRDRVKAVVVIHVDSAAEVVSPAYDDGATEEEVEARFLRRHGLVRAEREDEARRGV